MAVKKSKPAEATAKKASATPTPAPAAAAKPKKAAAAKPKATPAVASDTASKAETPKATAKATASAPKKAAVPKKVAAPVKLTDRQVEFLKQIKGAADPGFMTAKKVELNTILILMEKKLIKKGAKDKVSGSFRYTVSKAGEKHLSTLPPA